MTNAVWDRTFTAYACTKLEQNRAQIRRCAALLRPDELWRRENDHCNSIGNVILHLTGNISQWIVSGIGGAAYERDRASEFTQREPLPTERIVAAFDAAARTAIDTIARLDAAALLLPRQIQGYTVTSLEAVFHVVEHSSFHAGQIVHMTKVLRDVDLSLYDAAGHKKSGAPMTP